VGGTQAHWGLWMTVNSISFFHMHGDIHTWSLVTTKHSQDCTNKRGLPDHLWVLQRALEGRLGRTERSKGARGRIMHQRPEDRVALNKPSIHSTFCGKIETIGNCDVGFECG